MKAKRVPLRQCVACHEMLPKRELIRVVRTPLADVEIDLTGKKAGRGAYLCAKSACFHTATKQRSLDRALKTSVAKSIYERLASDFNRVQDNPVAMQPTSLGGDEHE